jgi:peptidoglycan/LPS O-acetylase OafA/YrhL
MGAFRVFLALAVVNSHMYNAAMPNIISGNVAVKLFFVISGFYMSLILERKYNDVTLFYTNRFLRLYPAYLFVLCLSIVWFLFIWLYTGHRPPPFWIATANASMDWWQWLLLQTANFTMIGLDFPSQFHWKSEDGFFYLKFPSGVTAPNGAEWVGWMPWIRQGWSIGAEIWFYMLAPFVLKRTLAIQIVVAATSVALMVCLESAGIESYYIFPANLWLFIAGSFLYRFYNSTYFVSDKRVGLTFLFFDTTAILRLGQASEPIKLIILALMAVSIPFLFHAFTESKRDSLFGELSYPIYLVHLIVISMLGIVFHFSSVLLAMIACLLVGALIVHFIETPIDSFRQRRILKKKLGQK